MMHKAWSSIGEMPYCFSRSSVKFQGHTGQKIDDFDVSKITRPVAAIKSLRFALLISKPIFLHCGGVHFDCETVHGLF